MTPAPVASGGHRVARTACRICAVGCGTIVEIDGERVVKIKGDPDDPWSLGYTCSKGRAGPEFHHDPARFDAPLQRVDGELVATTWDAALDDITGKNAARQSKPEVTAV